MAATDRIRTQIRFDPPKHGWSNLHLADNAGTEFSLDNFSYVFDPFDDFTRTAFCAMEDQPGMSVAFYGEPVEWRWTVDTEGDPSGAALDISVVEFPEFGGDPSRQGKTLLTYRCDRQAYARAVFRAMTALRDLGSEFEVEWRAPFPETSYNRLLIALRT